MGALHARASITRGRAEARPSWRFQRSISPPDDEPPATYPVVVANILANPLRVLAPAICGHVRPGGRLALSGILREQAEEIIAIYRPWIALEIFGEREGWVCLAGGRL